MGTNRLLILVLCLAASKHVILRSLPSSATMPLTLFFVCFLLFYLLLFPTFSSILNVSNLPPRLNRGHCNPISWILTYSINTASKPQCSNHPPGYSRQSPGDERDPFTLPRLPLWRGRMDRIKTSDKVFVFIVDRIQVLGGKDDCQIRI